MSRYDIDIRSCTTRQMSRHDMTFTPMHAFHWELAHFQAVNLCYDNIMDAQPSKSQLRKQERLARGLPAQCRSAETRKLVEISCE